MIIVWNLFPRDFQNEYTLCQKLLEDIKEYTILFCSDEVQFYLSGSINKQKGRYWCATNSHQLHEKPPSSGKVSVWCEISADSASGHYFCGVDNDVPINITSAISRCRNHFEPNLKLQAIQWKLYYWCCWDVWFCCLLVTLTGSSFH